MKPYRNILLLFIFIIPQILFAEVKVHGAFSDHMVIQQKTRISVWGWAKPGENIRVEGSWGVSSETITKADSTWQLKIKTPTAGGPYTITIKGENTIVIDDVLSGEVWLCTGQSNMDFEMYRFLKDSRESKYQPLVEEIRNEVATANDPWIRHIEVPRRTSMYVKKNDFKANWRSATKGNIDTITATGYYFAKELRKHLNVPIGLVECSWGGSRIQPWLAESEYMKHDKMKKFYQDNREKLKTKIEQMNQEGFVDSAYLKKHAKWIASGKTMAKPYPTEHPEKGKQTPATLYNGMVSAIMPYTVKGVLWYQGESNSHFQEDQYEEYFEALITSWRKDWGLGEMPFYWTQLAAYSVPDIRSDMGWAMVNDHLRRNLKLPHTGMAVLCDIGEAKDVHPHNKMDVGKRLAMWPLKNEYGIKLAEISGPLYEKSKIKGDKIILTFSHVEKGLMIANKHLTDVPVPSNDSLRWFEISGKDGIWKAAQANIISKNKIEVFNVVVQKPLYVRYAWSSNPSGVNLYNKAGLPAAVFSTEN